MQSVLKILFVDDHSGLRDGLSYMLTQKNPHFSFIPASDDKDAIEILKKNSEIQNAIIDINLDGQNGLDLVDELRKINKNLNVMIYTMYSDPIHIEQALKVNIQGYVTKDIELEEFEKAILMVTSGMLYYNKRAVQVMQSLLNDKAVNTDDEFGKSIRLVENYKKLTKKEQEVFKLLAQNKNTTEIASILGKAEKTVINQKSMIYGKLDLHDRMDVIESARTLGVIV